MASATCLDKQSLNLAKMEKENSGHALDNIEMDLNAILKKLHYIKVQCQNTILLNIFNPE
jgi:hypothetical protein